MKEEFVSYEQAKALKECGFDWKVNDGYSVKLRLEPEVSYGEPKEVHSNDPKNFNDNRKGVDKGIYFYSRPTQSLAAKWLREVKGIHVLPRLENVNKPDYACIITLMRKECLRIIDNNKYFKNYESALSQGIAQALTLLTEKQCP